MRRNALRRCKCGHAKSIHSRMYGKMYAESKLPKACNFPGCKCKNYAEIKEKQAQ